MSKFKIIFKIFLFIMLIVINTNVYAGGSDDDTPITYTTTWDDGYEYGNVKECSLKTGVIYRIGIVTVDGHKACLYNSEGGPGLNEFACEDSSMDSFEFKEVKGSDGKKYYGYGCRKPKSDDSAEYIKRELYVGYGEQMGEYGSYTCEIISGDSIEFDKYNECYGKAVKEGTSKIKVINIKSKQATYYEYTVISSDAKISDLDSNYNYGSVKNCHLGSEGHTLGGKVSFDNLTFCASSAVGYKYEYYEVSCQDSEYDTFQLTFSNGGESYKGYGCRKIKDESKIEYKKKELYVGYGEQVGDWVGYTCTIISGDAIQFNKNNECWVDAIKEGTSKIKVKNNDSGMAEYYEYKVLPLDTKLSDLDSNYVYGNVDRCSLGSQGYSLGEKVFFGGVIFCASSAVGYNYEKYDVTCVNDKYELFQLVFASGGKHYKGYGCRKLKEESPSQKPIGSNIDYNSLCSDNNIKASMKIIGYVILVVKWLAPLIIIVLGMVDFGKAVMSDDEQAINKATKSLIRRIISGVVIFFIPTIVYATLNLIKVTKGIETKKDSNFGACTLCLVKPLTDCKVEKR